LILALVKFETKFEIKIFPQSPMAIGRKEAKKQN